MRSPGVPDRLHRLIMEFVRAAGLLQPEQLAPGHAMSLSQAFAIHELDTDPPLSQRDLTERLRLEKSTVSRMVTELERRGLLRRERDPGNRRLHRLPLTDQGRDLHARIASTFHEHYVRWIATMTPAERDALLLGLSALVQAVREDRAPGTATTRDRREAQPYN